MTNFINPYTIKVNREYFFDFIKTTQVKKYIINKKATIIYFEDGSKTVVKRKDGDEFNEKLAFLTAYFQHCSGMSKTKANKFLQNLEVKE